jgi:hypothetical protein
MHASVYVKCKIAQNEKGNHKSFASYCELACIVVSNRVIQIACTSMPHIEVCLQILDSFSTEHIFGNLSKNGNDPERSSPTGNPCMPVVLSNELCNGHSQLIGF